MKREAKPCCKNRTSRVDKITKVLVRINRKRKTIERIKYKMNQGTW